MSAPYFASFDALGESWCVYDNRLSLAAEPVAGPMPRRSAESRARELNAEWALTEGETTPIPIPAAPAAAPLAPETAALLLRVLDGQERLNEGVVKALEALSLQADRYDSEIAELRRGINALTERCESAERAVRAAGLLHSVKS